MALTLQDFAQTIWNEIVTIFTYLYNTPYALGLILPLLFIILVLIWPRVKTGSRASISPTAYQERPQIIVQRGQGPSSLRIVLTSAVSSVLGAIVIVYILPTIGYSASVSIPFENLVVILFVIALVAALIVAIYTSKASGVKTSIRS